LVVAGCTAVEAEVFTAVRWSQWGCFSRTHCPRWQPSGIRAASNHDTGSELQFQFFWYQVNIAENG